MQVGSSTNHLRGWFLCDVVKGVLVKDDILWAS